MSSLIRVTAGVIRGRYMGTDGRRTIRWRCLMISEMPWNSRGVRVEYTRVGDVYNSPYEKAQIGNSSTADLFLSIHRNAMAVPGAASGTLSLIFGRGGDAETFAENINKKLAAVGWNDLGISERPNLVVLRIQHFRRFLWKLDLSTMRRTRLLR